MQKKEGKQRRQGCCCFPYRVAAQRRPIRQPRSRRFRPRTVPTDPPIRPRSAAIRSTCITSFTGGTFTNRRGAGRAGGVLGAGPIGGRSTDSPFMRGQCP
jgi:hypothetical protein